MILCHRHYKQLYRNGKVYERTIYDSNEIVEYDTYAEIYLYNKQGVVIHKAIIDLEEIERVKGYKWTFAGHYAKCEKKGIYLHNFILDYYGEEEIDHKNRNRLDNRKSNLRIVPHSLNSKNIKKPKHNKTGYIGVIWDKERNKWRAEIRCDGKTYHLGRYDDIEEAVRARLIAESKLFGEFSPQRHLFKEYNIPN